MDNWDDLSSAGKIRWLLSSGGDSSWGWVIYRCTYAPELATHWETFKRLVNEKTREVIAHSDAPEIVDQLDWAFVDHNPELEAASLDELKRRFRTWAREETQNPNYDIDDVPVGVSRGSRYTYFIRVDEEALRSFLVPEGPDNPTARVSLERGYVSIVRGLQDSPPTNDQATDQALRGRGR